MMRLDRLVICAAVALAVACDQDDPAPGIMDAGATPTGGDSGAGAPDSGTNGGGADAGPTDLGPTITDTCDPVQQTGCTAPRSKCIVENNPGLGTQCVAPDPGDIPLGGDCTMRAGQCQAKLACINSGTSPICRQVCNRQDGTGCEALGDDYDCREHIRGTNWGVCAELPPACTASTNEPCAAGEMCAPVRLRNGQFSLRCRAAGQKMHGEPCDAAGNRCAVGLVCVSLAGNPVCRTICTSDMDCPMMGECSGSVPGVDLDFCTP